MMGSPVVYMVNRNTNVGRKKPKGYIEKVIFFLYDAFFLFATENIFKTTIVNLEKSSR